MKYSAELKHHILTQYRPRSRDASFRALSRRYLLPPDGRTLKRWFQRWDGSVASLKDRQRSGRPPILNALQIHNFITQPVLAANRRHECVHYSSLYRRFRNSTHLNVSSRTIRRYGRECAGIRQLRVRRKSALELSKLHCEQLAQCRRSLQQIPKQRVVILDETHMRIGASESHTLVAKGQSSNIEVEDTTKYAPRFDMIACTSFTRTLPPIIYTPEDRAARGVKGINASMLEEYFLNILAPAIAALDQYPITMVMDKSNIHHTGRIMQALIDGGCQDVTNIVILPTQAAKRMSPLDNALFHNWKANVLKRGSTRSRSVEQVMADEWNSLRSDLIQSQYSHCLIMRRQDVYADCPDPAAHQHMHR